MHTSLMLWSSPDEQGQKLLRLWIHKSMVEIEDRQMQGCKYTRRRLPSLLRGSVDDIAASEDILGDIILYKPLLENIIVYYIANSLIYNNIILL